MKFFHMTHVFPLVELEPRVCSIAGSPPYPVVSLTSDPDAIFVDVCVKSYRYEVHIEQDDPLLERTDGHETYFAYRGSLKIADTSVWDHVQTRYATKKEKTHEILAFWMGTCLLNVQHAEESLKTVLTIVFPGRELNTLESLDAAENEVRRQTLGALVKLLRTRVDVAPDVATFLTEFRDRRNDFVHHFVGTTELNEDASVLEAITRLRKFSAEALAVYQLLSTWLATFAEAARASGVENLPSADQFAAVYDQIQRAIPAIVADIE